MTSRNTDSYETCQLQVKRAGLKKLWMRKKLIPNWNEHSLIVLDIILYHCRQQNNPLNKYSSNIAMTNCLLKNNIPFQPD